jgi:hypothetical protein
MHNLHDLRPSIDLSRPKVAKDIAALRTSDLTRMKRWNLANPALSMKQGRCSVEPLAASCNRSYKLKNVKPIA